jgi:hypothetical protein
MGREHVARWLPAKSGMLARPIKLAWQRYGASSPGRRCFGGFDVSSTQDITALIWLFPPEEPGRDVAAGVPFLGARGIRSSSGSRATRGSITGVGRERRARDDARRFRRPGLRRESDPRGDGPLPGRADRLRQLERGKLVGDLQKEHGVDPELLTIVRQGIHSLGEPSKQFERLVFAGQLDHGGHPVLKWMAGNVVIRFDENLNFMPAKKRRPRRSTASLPRSWPRRSRWRSTTIRRRASPWDNETFSMVAQ